LVTWGQFASYAFWLLCFREGVSRIATPQPRKLGIMTRIVLVAAIFHFIEDSVTDWRESRRKVPDLIGIASAQPRNAANGVAASTHIKCGS
jgi:hypothetical protein